MLRQLNVVAVTMGLNRNPAPTSLPPRGCADIRRSRRVAVLFAGEERHPCPCSDPLDFPETPHQNQLGLGPAYPCIQTIGRG